MNNVNLMGRLTKDPDIRYTQGQNQMAVARFTLAVDRRNKNPDGSRDADFISCVAFRKTAELAEKYFKQGTKLAIRGHIQTGSYQKQDGSRVYTTDVVVDEVDFAESKNAQNGGTRGASNGTPQGQQGQSHQATGKNSVAYEADPYADGFMNIPEGVDDEMLPFN